MGTVDAYLNTLDESTLQTFGRIRDLVVEMVPDVEQGTSYAMPAFLHRGKPLLAVLRAKRHLSLFPFSGRVVDAVRGDLEGFDLSRGTIRFSNEAPLPDDVVRTVVSERLREIDSGTRRP